MTLGDLIFGSCSTCGSAKGVSVLVEIKKTAYGWSRLVLLCSCGYNYEGSSLNLGRYENNEKVLGVDE